MASIIRMSSLFCAVYEYILKDYSDIHIASFISTSERILWIENGAVLPIENTPVYSKGSFCRDNETLLSPRLLKMSITKTRQNTESGDQYYLAKSTVTVWISYLFLYATTWHKFSETNHKNNNNNNNKKIYKEY